MGNRAIIKAEGNNNKAVYLHWNGGRDSVEGFLKYCELKGFRSFEDDYGMARFCQTVGNFLGGGLSLGIMDSVGSPGDNGVYVVRGWEIVGREDYSGPEQQEHSLIDMLIAIDAAQPDREQLGEDFFDAEEIEVKDLKIGDEVFRLNTLENKIEKFTVVGIGEDKSVNGRNVLGIPYVNKYINQGDYSNNCNNYLREGKIRVVRRG